MSLQYVFPRRAERSSEPCRSQYSRVPVAKLSCVALRRTAARPKHSASSFIKGQQVVTQEGLGEALWMFEISGGRVVQGQGYSDPTPGDSPRILSSRYAFCADLPLSSDL